MDNINYEIIDLNLQRLTIIRIAVYMWTALDMKEDLRGCFEIYIKMVKLMLDKNDFNFVDLVEKRRDVEEYKDRGNKEWKILTEKVLKKLEQIIIPCSLQSELTLVITEIGLKIRLWTEYNQCKRLVELKNFYRGKEEEDLRNYMENVSWTYYGTIDETNTFKLLDANDPSIDITDLYIMACDNMVEKRVEEIWEQLPQKLQRTFTKYQYAEHGNEPLIAYWSYTRNGSLSKLAQFCHLSDIILAREASLTIRMFILTVNSGHFEAMKYFYGKLNKDERAELIVIGALMAAKHFVLNTCPIQYYNEKRVETYMFLFKQMSTSFKEKLFSEGIGYYFMLTLSTWPWNELSIVNIHGMWQYFDDDTNISYGIINSIVRNMVRIHSVCGKLKNNKYRSLLHNVWRQMPSHLKPVTSLIDETDVFDFEESVISTLFELWDIESLNLIINSPEMAHDRDGLIECLTESLEQLRREGKCELFNEFMETILLTDEEKLSITLELHLH